MVLVQRAGAALLLSGALFASPALADLNKYEQAAGGEFGSGTALQYGSAEAEGRSFDGEVLLTIVGICLLSIHFGIFWCFVGRVC